MDISASGAVSRTWKMDSGMIPMTWRIVNLVQKLACIVTGREFDPEVTVL